MSSPEVFARHALPTMLAAGVAELVEANVDRLQEVLDAHPVKDDDAE